MANGITVPISLTGTRFTTERGDRQIDLLISKNLNFVDGGQVDLVFGDTEKEVAGAQKLVQKWIILFLTKVGTVQADDNFGTNFMRNLEQGRVRTDADVRLEFSDAASRVSDFLVQSDLNNPNLDEKLDRAELLEFNITGDKLFMRVRIISQAGEGTDVILPTPLENR